MMLHPVYPFELTKKNLESILSNNIYFAALDMLQGYFQVPLDEEINNLTVFVTPWGKYKYLHTPMGLALSNNWFNAFTLAASAGR